MTLLIDFLYTFMTFCGLFLFQKKRPFVASMAFGMASALSVLPLFAFFPVLFVFGKDSQPGGGKTDSEKNGAESAHTKNRNKNRTRVRRVFAPIAIFLAFVILGYFLPFGFASHLLQISALNAKLFVVAYSALLVASWLMPVQTQQELFVASYAFMIAAVLPFLLAVWEPGWVIPCVAAVVNTSLFVRKKKRSLLIDFAGLLAFVMLASVIFFPAFGFVKFLMLFSQNTGSVYFSVFWAYLAVQPILKFSLVLSSFNPALEWL